MFMTNRSIPNLYYLKQTKDGSLIFMSSSRGTEAIVES